MLSAYEPMRRRFLYCCYRSGRFLPTLRWLYRQHTALGAFIRLASCRAGVSHAYHDSSGGHILITQTLRAQGTVARVD